MPIMKQLRQRATEELVPRGHTLNVIATAPNSCRVTKLSRLANVDPGTPMMVDINLGFETYATDDMDYAYRIEAMTDSVVYYQVSKGQNALLIIDEQPRRVPME